MSTNFRKLFSIHINHQYYTDGNGNADFEIEPTLETARLLQSKGMRFLNGPAGIHVLYRVNLNPANGHFEPFIPTTSIAANVKLRFQMRLKNPYFFNFSQLAPTKPLRSSFFHFKSASAIASGSLATGNACLSISNPIEVDYRNPVFSYTYQLSDDPAIGVLHVLDENSNFLQEYVSNINEEGDFIAHLELSRLGAGTFLLQKIKAGLPEGAAEKIYIDPSINPSQTFGLLEVGNEAFWKTVHDFNEIPGQNEHVKLELNFAKRDIQWIYKIVFRKTPLPPDLLVEPVIIEEAWVAIPGNRYHQSEPTDKMRFIAAGLPTSFDGQDMLMFKSVDDSMVPLDKSFPLYQETKQNLRLKIDGDTLISALPNPDYKNLKNEVIIYV